MATTKMMTERELLTAIVNGETVTSEMVSKAQAMLDSLDRKNAKRKESGTKTQQENATIKGEILSALESGKITTTENGYVVAKAVADYLKIVTENPDFSTQKASALLGQLATSGELETGEIKTKSGKVKGYRIPVES